jgi:hypothetical protein
MLVGGGQAMMTGDLNKGLMAGIGAYGGAGMGQYMANAGSVVPAAVAKDTVVQPTAAELAPVNVPVEAAPAPTGFKFSNTALGGDSNTSAAVQDALANYRMPAMQTNSAVEAYLQNNRSMMPLSTPTSTSAISNAPEFLTPRQLGSFPGGSSAPTVMNTAKDFDAFQRGLTGENALSFMKANPMQAAALASGPLMEATTATPPKAAVDSDRGANANAGIKYRPNFVNPLPAPNRYGIEQIYNRPAYMAEGGLTPALRTYQELQRQRADRGSQIDTRNQFDEYMKSIRGGTVRPTLPPVPTPKPITPNTPIDTSTINTGGGGGGNGGGGDGEGGGRESRYSPTSPMAGIESGSLGFQILDAYGRTPFPGAEVASLVSQDMLTGELAQAGKNAAKAEADARAGYAKGTMFGAPPSDPKTFAGAGYGVGNTMTTATGAGFPANPMSVDPAQAGQAIRDATLRDYSPSELAGASMTTPTTEAAPTISPVDPYAVDSDYVNTPAPEAAPTISPVDPYAVDSDYVNTPAPEAAPTISPVDPYAVDSDYVNTPAPEAAPTISPVDPYAVDSDYTADAQAAAEAAAAANTAATTAAQIDRINALMAADREAEAAKTAEKDKEQAEKYAAIAEREAVDASLAEKNAAIQAALESSPSVSLGTSTMPTGTDLAGTSSSLLGTGDPFAPTGPDISSPQKVGAAPSDGGAPPSGGSGDSDGGSQPTGPQGYQGGYNPGIGPSDGGDQDGGDQDGGDTSAGDTGSRDGTDSDSGGEGADGGDGDARGGYLQHGQFDQRMAQGGYAYGGLPNPYNLGSYSDGGRLLKGPGDGVSDSIPATIGKGQPARLADGEFVIPARIVSEIGNGSTDAGARKLYAMMDRIQASRKKTVGKGKVAKNTRAEKYLPR